PFPAPRQSILPSPRITSVTEPSPRPGYPGPTPNRAASPRPGGSIMFSSARINGAGGVALAGVLWAAFPPAPARAQDDPKDWPTYTRDARGTRHNPGETALNRSNAGRLTEKWRFPAKDSGLEIGVIHATPVVVGGYVYFGTATDPAFYKLAPDGRLRWS